MASRAGEVLATWCESDWGIGVSHTLKNLKILHEEETPFQKLIIAEHGHFGRLLVLDDIIQTTQFDESIYHEMMVTLPLFAHPKTQNNESLSVLIIGGGDGGALREALCHDFVKKVVMVEIDGRVVELCKEYLGFQGNYEDSRAELIIGDAFEYLKNPQNQAQKFDLIVVDATDPHEGTSALLYTDEFYQLANKALTDEGLLSRHVGVPAYQPGVITKSVERIRQTFPNTQIYRAAIPAYSGGDMAFLISGKNPNFVASKVSKEFVGKYYNPAIHQASFALPTSWQKWLG